MDVQKSWAIGNNFIKEAIKLSSEILDSLNKKIPEVPTQQLVFYDFAIRAHCCLKASRLL
ncbi:MAG: hypothetical protein IPP77_13185 [Bacteroidetes bacterium]|nr:hypothetical protein [Bacteroidota bacterium]